MFTTTCPYPGRDKSSPRPPPTFLISILISFSHLRQCPPSDPVPSYLPPKISSLPDNNSITNNAVKHVFKGTWIEGNLSLAENFHIHEDI